MLTEFRQTECHVAKAFIGLRVRPVMNRVPFFDRLPLHRVRRHGEGKHKKCREVLLWNHLLFEARHESRLPSRPFSINMPVASA